MSHPDDRSGNLPTVGRITFGPANPPPMSMYATRTHYALQLASAERATAKAQIEALKTMLIKVCVQYENVRRAENYPTADSACIREARALCANLENLP